MDAVNVPMACARKGNRKFMGVNRCIEALSPSVVVVSAPNGAGIKTLQI